MRACYQIDRGSGLDAGTNDTVAKNDQDGFS